MYERADTSFQQSTEHIYLNNTLEELGFQFYVGFSDIFGNMPNEISGYLDIEIRHVDRHVERISTAESGADSHTVGTHKCDESDVKNAPAAFNEEITEFMHGVLLRSGYCVDSSSENRLLNDPDKSITTKYLEVLVKRCQANDCKKKEEID